MSETEQALKDFNDGFTHGWNGLPQEPGRGPSYKSAYEKAAKLSKDFADAKERSDGTWL